MEFFSTIDFDLILWLFFGLFLMFIGTIPVFMNQDKRFPYEAKTDSKKSTIITLLGMMMLMAAMIGFAINEYSGWQVMVVIIIVIVGGFIPIKVLASR